MPTTARRTRDPAGPCSRCGQPRGHTQDQGYCRPCQAITRGERRRAARQLRATCEACGMPMAAERANQKYHDNACRQRAKRARAAT